MKYLNKVQRETVVNYLTKARKALDEAYWAAQKSDAEDEHDDMLAGQVLALDDAVGKVIDRVLGYK